MTEIIPGVLYLGPAQSVRRLNGMRAIINLARRFYDGQRRHFPLVDGLGSPVDMLVAVAIIRRRVRAGRVPIYLHCHAGRSRSPLVATLYLLRYDRRFTTFDQAFAYVKRLHPMTNPNTNTLSTARKAGLFICISRSK